LKKVVEGAISRTDGHLTPVDVSRGKLREIEGIHWVENAQRTNRQHLGHPLYQCCNNGEEMEESYHCRQTGNEAQKVT